MDQQLQSPNSPENRKRALNHVAFLVRTLATSVEVFLHRGMGERYLQGQAAGVLLLVIVYGPLTGLAGLDWLFAFLGFYLIACVGVRADIISRLKAGEIEHSYYTGAPRLLRWPLFRRLPESTLKGTVEPMVVFVAGCLFLPVSEALGSYLLIAGLALAISVTLAETYERTRLMDMQDALIDQRRRAELFRQRDWRNR